MVMGIFGLYGEKEPLAVYISKNKQREKKEKKSTDQQVEGDMQSWYDLRGVQIARVLLKVGCIYEQIRSNQISNQTKEDFVDFFFP